MSLVKLLDYNSGKHLCTFEFRRDGHWKFYQLLDKLEWTEEIERGEVSVPPAEVLPGPGC